jgi:glycosyltransferase involved in cell wall biosynthesis
MNGKHTINITFPVLNEEGQLAASVHRTLEFCATSGIENFEICIADNGSTDSTPAIGRNLAEAHERVEYLSVGKRGFGLALKTAWGEAQTDFCGYMDVDLATGLKHLKQVYDLIQSGAGYDLYLASRLMPGAKVTNRKLLRAFTSRAFNKLLAARLGVGFTDAMCGFKFIRTGLYRDLASRFEFTDDWFFATQLAVRAEWLGAKILDFPVEWSDDPNSKSSARLVNLSRLYLAGIAELREEKRRFFQDRSGRISAN